MSKADRFAARLKELRASIGLTLKELAERAGITPDAIVKLESGIRGPTWETVVALADAIGVDYRAFASKSSPVPPETRKIILWVDDRPQESSMWDWLQNKGVAILSARSTARAMELFRRATCDAIITDLRRKENGVMNNSAGIELTQQIRRGNPDVPILIYTMNIDVATQRLALGSGATLITASPAKLREELQRLAF